MGHQEDNLTTQLTKIEKAELETLEGVITREMGSFIAVGKALVTIRDKRLYREDFKTFKDYCNEKWGMSKTHANRLITGSQVAVNLTPIGALCAPCEIQPTSEYQTRPLAALEPDQQREVWKEAVENAPAGKVPTHEQVKALVDELVGPAPPAPLKKQDPHPESDAMYFANIARSQLERIRDDDPKQKEALLWVKKWINEKLTLMEA